MPAPRRRRPTTALALALTLVIALTGLFAGAPAAQAQSATTQGTWAPSTTHPFSDPKWLPLRKTAAVSCTYKNCPGPYHGYWAIDFLGQRGDPVYAAGAGIFHIGAVDSSCKTAGSPDAPGTWVWIDHGGGVVSRYHHLDSVTAQEGQYVTPSTVIGRMGHSGDFAPCTTNYLHFEVRHGGLTGTRVNPGQLWGCVGTSRQSYPAAFGYSSWNNVPKAVDWVPQLGNDCLPSSTDTAAAPGAVSGGRGNASARITWGLPSSRAGTVTGYVVSQELWSPSVGAWNSPIYLSATASQTSTTATGLANGRRYRFRVLARNSVGDSAWTPYVEVVPATAPAIPATNRGLTASSGTVRFYWWKAAENGTPVTSYTVATRRQFGSRWSAWSYTTVSARTFNYKFAARRGATYQVTVRANSSAGSSRYGVYRSITTPRR